MCAVRSPCGFRALLVRSVVNVPGMTEQRMHDPYGAGDGGGRYGRDAEHALVAALVLGQANPADLSGRLSGRDFYDPAAGLIFDTVLRAARGMPGDPGGAFDRL